MTHPTNNRSINIQSAHAPVHECTNEVLVNPAIAGAAANAIRGCSICFQAELSWRFQQLSIQGQNPAEVEGAVQHPSHRPARPIEQFRRIQGASRQSTAAAARSRCVEEASSIREWAIRGNSASSPCQNAAAHRRSAANHFPLSIRRIVNPKGRIRKGAIAIRVRACIDCLVERGFALIRRKVFNISDEIEKQNQKKK